MADAEYYKNLMSSADTTDYTGGEFLGEQGMQKRKSDSAVKKWGNKPRDQTHAVNDWLGASPGKQRKSYKIKEKKVAPTPDLEEEKVKEDPVSSPPPKAAEPVVATPKEETKAEEKTPEPVEDPEIAKYKAMMFRDEGNDYATNEFLGEQAATQRKSEPAKKWGNKPRDTTHVNNDWLGASPRKARKSYTIKEKKTVPPPEVDEPKKEEPAPTPAPAVEKKEEDPEIAKYKAMMFRDEGNDYATNEFLGEQAATQRKSTPAKKWGNQARDTTHVNNDWLGASPTKARKSYTIKEKKTVPAPQVDESKDEAPKEEPKKEVDPEIEKYKAMMFRDEGNDYATNEFLGEQASFESKTKPAKKWGNQARDTSHVNNDWLGASPGGTRKSYTIKSSSSSKSPSSPVGSSEPAYGGFTSPVSGGSGRTRASFSHFSPSHRMTSPLTPDVKSSVTTTPVSEKERSAGRKSFSNAFAKFKSNDTAVPAAFATAMSPGGTKRNYRVSKEARDMKAHVIPPPVAVKKEDDWLKKHQHNNNDDEDESSGLEGDQKKEYDEALAMLQKVFIRLDDREPSWKQMDAVIKKIKKATKRGADIKAILSYSISSLQHIAGLLYLEDKSDTEDVVEKLIDLNLEL